MAVSALQLTEDQVWLEKRLRAEVSDMAEQSCSKPEDLGSVPEPHMVEREN